MGAPTNYNAKGQYAPMRVDDLDIWGWGSAIITALLVGALLFELLKHWG